MVDKRADAAAAYAKAPKPPPAHEAPAGPPGPAAPGPTPELDTAVEPSAPAPTAASEPDAEPAAIAEDGGLLPQDLDELAAKAQMADEYLVLAQRTQADFENYRKRAVRDTAQAQERGVARLAKELLPAIDSLDRAAQAAAETETAQLVDGIRLVQADLLAALGRVGIEPFSPVGEPFDPQLHEAVAQNEVEGAEPGTVVEVFQLGYRLGDAVLRPARVLVAS